LVKIFGDPVGLKEQAGLSIPCFPSFKTFYLRGAGGFKKVGDPEGKIKT